MEKRNKYDIVLEKGAAIRPYYEMTEMEREELSRRIFLKVWKDAAEIGAIPITKSTLNAIRKKRDR